MLPHDATHMLTTSGTESWKSRALTTRVPAHPLATASLGEGQHGEVHQPQDLVEPPVAVPGTGFLVPTERFCALIFRGDQVDMCHRLKQGLFVDAFFSLCPCPSSA